MICSKCGTMVADDSIFCMNCGNRLVGQVPQNNVNMQPPQMSNPAQPQQYAPNIQPVQNNPGMQYVQMNVNPNAQAVMPNGMVIVDPNVNVKVIKAKKKSHKLWFIIGIPVLLIAGFALTVFLSSGLRNKLKRAFMSDEDYFKSVERTFIDGLLDTALDAYGDVREMCMEQDLKFEVDASVVSNKYADDFFEQLSNFESDVDLSWIKNGKANIVVSLKDKMMQTLGKLTVNDTEAMDADIIVDLEKMIYYANIPMYSDKYAEYDFGNYLIQRGNIPTDYKYDLSKSKAVFEALPDKETLRKIINRYLDIVFDNVGEILIEENDELTANGVSNNYCRMTFKIKDATCKKILKALLKELKNDSEINEILKKLSKTGYEQFERIYDEYKERIDNELEWIDERSYDNQRFDLWVDDGGNVVGQQLAEVRDKNADGIVYKLVVNGDEFGFECGETKDGKFDEGVKAGGSISGKCLTGEAWYEDVYSHWQYPEGTDYWDYRDYDDEDIPRTWVTEIRKSVAIGFEDLDVLKLFEGKIDGRIKLDFEQIGKKEYSNRMENDSSFAKLVRDKELIIEVDDFKISTFSPNIKLTLLDDGKEIINGEISVKKSSASSIDKPSNTIKLADDEDTSAWTDKVKWDVFLKTAKAIKMSDNYYDEVEDWVERIKDGRTNDPKYIFRSIGYIIDRIMYCRNLNYFGLYEKSDERYDY